MYDLTSGAGLVEDAGVEGRLQVSVHGEALFFLDALPGVLVLGYEPVEGEEDMVVSLVEIAPRRWVVAAKLM